MAKQKVKVNGKELYTDSDEYKYLYNNNHLAAISDDPTIGFEKTAPTVEVIGEAPRWLKEKREREKYYDPNLTKQENERKYQAKKTIQGWKSADINQPGGLERAGDVMSFPLKSAGAGLLFGGEMLNTIPAAIGEAVSGRGNYLAALPNPLRAAENAGITGMWDPNADQQKTTGQVFFPNNPYAAMAVDLPLDIATGKVLGTGAKMLGKIPKFSSKASKIDDVEKLPNDYINVYDKTDNIAQEPATALDIKNIKDSKLLKKQFNLLPKENININKNDVQDQIKSIIQKFDNQNTSTFGQPSKSQTLTDVNDFQFKRNYLNNLVDNVDANEIASIVDEYKLSNPNLNDKQINFLVLKDPRVLKYTNKKTDITLDDNYEIATQEINKKDNLYPNVNIARKDIPNLRTLRDYIEAQGKIPEQNLNTDFTPEEMLSISRYTRGYDSDMNKIARDIDFANRLPKIYSDALKDETLTLTEAIKKNKFEKETELFRRSHPFNAKIKQKDGTIVEKRFPVDLEEGDEFLEEGFQSTATSTPYSVDYIIEVPGGKKQSFLFPNSVPRSSHYPNESEALLPPGLKLQHTGKTQKRIDKYNGEQNVPIFRILNPYSMFGAVGTGAALNELRKQNQMEGETKYKMGGRVEGKSGMSTNPLSRLTNKNGAYGLHVEGRYGHVDGRYGHVDGRYGHVDGEKGMQVKYKKGGYLKDEDTYVTEDGKETRRGLWANVHLKNKREGKAEYGIRVINPFLWKKDYDKKHSYEEGGEIDEDDDYYNNELVPVEIENSERVYMKKEDGSYHLMLETDKTAPRHEEGGVKLGLPEDSLVFPKQYFNELDDAMDEGNATGDWSMMDEVADKMLANAQKAYDEGKPYSSGGDSDRDLSKMRCGGCGSKMGMGGKCNRCGGGTKYGFGGALRRLYQNGGKLGGPGSKRMDGKDAKSMGRIGNKESDKETIKEVQPGKFTPDKSLPNLGYAKREQAILNELIAKDKGEALVLDDIIGEKTLGAMKKYEGKGYKRPVLFSDENLALYKKQWEEIVAKKKGSSESQAETETKKEEKKSANETVESEESADNEKIYDDLMTAMDFFGMYRDAKESKKRENIETTKGMFKNWVSQLPEKKTTESKIDQTPMPGAESWTQSFANALGTGYPMDLSKSIFNNLKNQGTPAEFLEKEGWTKVPSESVTVTDGDGVIINNKKYRLSDLQGGDAYFDAAESYAKSYSGEYFQQYYQDEKGNKVNTSKKALEEIVKNKPFIYIKDSGKKSHDRIIAGLMYGGDNDMYHSSDSAMVTLGEAVYGVEPDDKRMTERQKNITNRAKSEFKYKKYPDEIRTSLELPFFKHLAGYIMPSDFSNKKKK